MQIQSSKSIFASKTFWYNAATTVAVVTLALMNLDWVKENPGVTAVLVMVDKFINGFALRMLSHQPVTLMPQ